jgi:hypothetical protein
MSACLDELVERFEQSMEVLLDLPAGHVQLQRLKPRYAVVQLWAGRGRSDKAAAAVDALLQRLGV